MRHLLGLLILLCLIFATGAGAQQARRPPAHPKENARTAARHDHEEDEEPPFKMEGGGKIAAGWSAKVDKNDSLTKVRFEPTAGGWHARTAVPVVLFRATDAMTGNYRLTVTFAQTEGTPGHAEAYGLLLGASGLAGDAAKQRYTSFVIRGDGKFQIRRRAAGKGTDVTNGLVVSRAIHKLDAQGRCSNELTVVVGAAEVQFLVNGTEVHRARRADVDADGGVAFRLSHNLDLNISAFSLTKG